MAMLKPGDYVKPVMKVDDPQGPIDATELMTPCQVTTVYKNGNIHAVSDDGKVSHHGPASGFQKIRSNR